MPRSKVRGGRRQRWEERLHPAALGPLGGEVSAGQGGELPFGSRGGKLLVVVLSTFRILVLNELFKYIYIYIYIWSWGGGGGGGEHIYIYICIYTYIYIYRHAGQNRGPRTHSRSSRLRRAAAGVPHPRHHSGADPDARLPALRDLPGLRGPLRHPRRKLRPVGQPEWATPQLVCLFLFSSRLGQEGAEVPGPVVEISCLHSSAFLLGLLSWFSALQLQHRWNLTGGAWKTILHLEGLQCMF